MGSGASKRVDDGFEDEDIFDEDYEENIQRQMEEKRIATRNKEKEKKLINIFGAKKPPPRVVGMLDSDEEDAPRDTKVKSKFDLRPKDVDKELKEEINELEHTFNSLGLVGKKMWTDTDYSEETTRKLASSGRWNNNNAQENPGSANSNEYLTQSYSQHSRFPPRTSHSRQRQPTGYHLQLGAKNNQRPLKFSWDGPDNLPKNKESEEWTYKKTVIEGFDPDRFRKANKGVAGPQMGSFSRPSSQAPVMGPKLTRQTSMDIPGVIPTYDRTYTPKPEWESIQAQKQGNTGGSKKHRSGSRSASPPTNPWKCSALVAAIALGYTDTVECLIERSLINIQCSSNGTALDWAAFLGQEEVCQMILTSTELERQSFPTGKGPTTWHAAVRGRSVPVVRYLREEKSLLPIVNHGDKEDHTPLYRAVQLGLTDIVAELVKCPDIDLNDLAGGEDRSNETTILAIVRRNLDIIKLLLNAGAEITPKVARKAIETEDREIFWILGIQSQSQLKVFADIEDLSQAQTTFRYKEMETFNSMILNGLPNEGEIYDTKGGALKGTAFILNFESFDELSTRGGSDKDVNKLKHLFGEVLKMNVTTSEGKKVTRKEAMNQLQGFAKDPKLDQASFAFIVVMSHGDLNDQVLTSGSKKQPENGILSETIAYEEIFTMFNATNCQKLRGKPKVFILNACRGRESQERYSDVETDAVRIKNDVHNHGDMLMIYATSPGHVSYRHNEQGAIFINQLIQIFKCNFHRYDVARMMTM
eukprot:maker-scaffold409_size180341-snap-gene-0.26 protein:Tk00894 transcript:maker-scaffold409_size180341-snap-gene-0.26-mRNA-1 annotation:"PREDICTED: uncharacterized protein LOC100954360"